MTVAELIKKLEQLPQDAVIYRDDNEYQGSMSAVRKVDFQYSATFGRPGNTVVLK